MRNLPFRFLISRPCYFNNAAPNSIRSSYMRLFLCEKPSQGRDIAKVLGATGVVMVA
jgi:hypothetical protein